MALISYIRAVFTNSQVTVNFKHDTNDNNEEPATTESTEIFETKYSLERKRKNSNLRFCVKCQNDKPDRSHHCSKCEKCILKMDHHCPWVNQCVGWRNYKFFMLFISYTTLLCAFGCISLLLDSIEWDWTNFGWREIILIICFVIAVIFGAILIGFSLMHYQFVLANLTTIESFERDRDSKFESPYDVGPYQNWKQVFGDNPLFWFLPIGNSSGDGIHFPIRKSMLLVNEGDPTPLNNTEYEGGANSDSLV